MTPKVVFPVVRRRRQLPAAERGHVTVLAVIMLPILLFGFVGLIWDGGQAVNRRSEAFDLANAAARAGATAIDEHNQVTGSGALLDPAEADFRAGQYLSNAGTSGTVAVTDTTVTVTVTLVHTPDFLGFVGVGAFTMTATGSAQAQVGVAGPEQ